MTRLSAVASTSLSPKEDFVSPIAYKINKKLRKKISKFDEINVANFTINAPRNAVKIFIVTA